jgi:hypothetical protein
VRARALALVLACVALLGAACSNGEGGSSAAAKRAHPGRDLPPNDRERLAAVFDPALEELGLRLARGALVDTRGGRYEPSDTGRHLAVYVEPTGPYTPAQYAEGIVTSARAFLPEVFERWEGVETFDVCQEPLPGVDDRAEPPPVTQLYLTRREARGIEWSDARLADLLAEREPQRPDYTLYIAPAVMADPAFALISQS